MTKFKIALLLMVLACTLSAGAQDATKSAKDQTHSVDSPVPKARSFDGPKVGESFCLSMDTVAGVTDQAFTQYCTSWNKRMKRRLEKDGEFDQDKFNDQEITKSKGQLVKLAMGTQVRILSLDAHTAKIQIDDTPNRSAIYFMSTFPLKLRMDPIKDF